MKSILKWTGFATMLALAAASPARAQVSITGNLNVPQNIPSTGGWTVTFTSCLEYATTCASTIDFTGAVVGNQLSLVFTGSGGPTNDRLVYNTSGLQDLTVDFTVRAPTGQSIYLATDTISSSSFNSNTAAGNFVTASETVTTKPAIISVLGVSPLLQSETFAPMFSGPLSVHLDTKAGQANNTFAGSYVQSVTLTFNAPEPVSTSLLAVGFAGLCVARRKFRRS